MENKPLLTEKTERYELESDNNLVDSILEKMGFLSDITGELKDALLDISNSIFNGNDFSKEDLKNRFFGIYLHNVEGFIKILNNYGVLDEFISQIYDDFELRDFISYYAEWFLNPMQDLSFYKINEDGTVDYDKDSLLLTHPKAIKYFVEDLFTKGVLEGFLDSVKDDYQIVALLSYWEKWFINKVRVLMDECFNSIREVRNGELPFDLDSRYTEKELQILFLRLEALQLTYGCSQGCRYCALDATPKVRDQFNLSEIEKVFSRYAKYMSSFTRLYNASEPHDHKDFSAIYKVASKYLGHHTHVTTSITDDEQWIHFLQNDTGANFRLSLSSSHPTASTIVDNVRTDSFMALGQAKEVETYRHRYTAVDHEKHINYLGRGSLKNQSPLDAYSVNSVNGGVLMTPRGLYNIINIQRNLNSTVSTKQFPQYLILSPLGDLSEYDVNPGEDVAKVLSNSLIVDSNDFHSFDLAKLVVYRKKAYYELLYDIRSLKVESVKKVPFDEYEASTSLGGLDKYDEDLILNRNLKAVICEKNHEETSGATPHISSKVIADVFNILRKDTSKFKVIEKSGSYAEYQIFVSADDLSELMSSFEEDFKSHDLIFKVKFYPVMYTKNRSSDGYYYPVMLNNSESLKKEAKEYQPRVGKAVRTALEEGQYKVIPTHFVNFDYSYYIERFYEDILSKSPDKLIYYSRGIEWEYIYPIDVVGRDLKFHIRYRNDDSSVEIKIGDSRYIS